MITPRKPAAALPRAVRLAWIAALACMLPPPLPAEVVRMAILAGANEGLAAEQPLRYAARDAREMAALLRNSGAFAKGDIHLHADEGVDRIRQSLEAVARRQEKLSRAGVQTLLLFFYSGHGSADALHIRGKRFPREELVAYLDSLGSDLKIVILDACESGDFLRKKGLRVLDGEGVRVEDNLRSRGSILLSSSSQGEASQESEEYRSAVFSHHLMNGLRGLADYNRDRAVSIMEAFDYARASTRLERVHGAEGAQNPAFDFDLVGEADPVITRLPPGRSRLTLTGMPWAPLEIYEADSRTLAYRVWLTGRDSLSFSIPAGKYLLCLRERDAVLTREVDLAWDGEAEADRREFRRRPAAAFARKGGRAPIWNPHGLRLAFDFTEAIPGLRLPLFRAGYEHRGYYLHQAICIGYGSGLSSGEEFDNAVTVIRAGYSVASPLFRWRLGQATLGVSGSWDYVRQVVDDKRFPGPIETGSGTVPLRRRFDAQIWGLSIPLEHELHLPGGLWISGGAAAGLSSFRDRAAGGRAVRAGWSPTLGFGYRF